MWSRNRKRGDDGQAGDGVGARGCGLRRGGATAAARLPGADTPRRLRSGCAGVLLGAARPEPRTVRLRRGRVASRRPRLVAFACRLVPRLDGDEVSGPLL